MEITIDLLWIKHNILNLKTPYPWILYLIVTVIIGRILYKSNKLTHDENEIILISIFWLPLLIALISYAIPFAIFYLIKFLVTFGTSQTKNQNYNTLNQKGDHCDTKRIR